MTLVAGIDSSTQTCKVIIRDAESGALIREGRSSHPPGTEVDPQVWWIALQEAARAAGGLDDVAAIAVGGQQHGMICLDEDGKVIRPALLWNDTRSARAAEDLVAELGGPQTWADAVGSVPVASFTVTKLRWLAENEPANAARTAAVCLPHDWLTWKLAGATDGGSLATDRSDASGTGYWSPATGTYRPDLLRLALGHEPRVPVVLAANRPAGSGAQHRPAGGPTGRPGHQRGGAGRRSRRQRRCRTRRGRRGRRRRRLHRHIRRGLRRQPVADRGPVRNRGRFRVRDRRVPPPRLHAQRGASTGRCRGDAAGRPFPALPARARCAAGSRGSSPRAISGRRTHAQSARRHRRVARTDLAHQHPPRPTPSGHQGLAVRAGRWP